MGTFRYILAICVVLSHTGLMIFDHGIGVISVAVFYLINGFTMQSLLEKYYFERQYIKFFLVDRFWRIFPMFFVVVIITVIIKVFVGIPNEINPYFVELDLIKILENCLILPLGYYMFNGLSNCLVVPQAWTLGLEFSFWIVFPFFFFLSRKNKKLLIVLSLSIFTLAYLGVIVEEWFSYRLLPGTFFIFACGSFIYGKIEKDKMLVLKRIWIYLFALYLASFVIFDNVTYSRWVILGVLIGIPSLLLLKKLSYTLIDSFLGNVSYGVYINHFMIMWLMREIPFDGGGRLRVIVFSSGLAVLMYFAMDKYVQKCRIHYRKKHCQNSFDIFDEPKGRL